MYYVDLKNCFGGHIHWCSGVTKAKASGGAWWRLCGVGTGTGPFTCWVDALPLEPYPVPSRTFLPTDRDALHSFDECHYVVKILIYFTSFLLMDSIYWFECFAIWNSTAKSRLWKTLPSALLVSLIRKLHQTGENEVGGWIAGGSEKRPDD